MYEIMDDYEMQLFSPYQDCFVYIWCSLDILLAGGGYPEQQFVAPPPTTTNKQPMSNTQSKDFGLLGCW